MDARRNRSATNRHTLQLVTPDSAILAYRIRLVPFDEHDHSHWEIMQTLMSSKAAMKYFDRGPCAPEEWLPGQRMYNRVHRSWKNFIHMIQKKGSQEYIGFAGIYHKNGHMEPVLLVNPDYQSEMVATEAVYTLGVYRMAEIWGFTLNNDQLKNLTPFNLFEWIRVNVFGEVLPGDATPQIDNQIALPNTDQQQNIRTDVRQFQNIPATRQNIQLKFTVHPDNISSKNMAERSTQLRVEQSQRMFGDRDRLVYAKLLSVDMVRNFFDQYGRKVEFIADTLQRPCVEISMRALVERRREIVAPVHEKHKQFFKVHLVPICVPKEPRSLTPSPNSTQDYGDEERYAIHWDPMENARLHHLIKMGNRSLFMSISYRDVLQRQCDMPFISVRKVVKIGRLSLHLELLPKNEDDYYYLLYFIIKDDTRETLRLMPQGSKRRKDSEEGKATTPYSYEMEARARDLEVKANQVHKKAGRPLPCRVVVQLYNRFQKIDQIESRPFLLEDSKSKKSRIRKMQGKKVTIS